MKTVNRTAAEVKLSMLAAIEKYAADIAVASLRGVSVTEVMRERKEFGHSLLGNIPDCYFDDIYRFINSFDERRELRSDTLGDVLADALTAQAWVPVPDLYAHTPFEPWDSVALMPWQRMAIRGERINAIKEFRELAGRTADGRAAIGLREAKNAVENYIDQCKKVGINV